MAEDFDLFMRDNAHRIIEDGDCLLWTGATCNGHPAINERNPGKRKTVLVRRRLWALANGPIPPGKIIRCNCDVSRCVNLAHCELTTYRKVAQHFGALGVMSGPVRSAKIAAVKRAGRQARITQDEAQAIRASEESSTVLSQRHGIAVSTVCRIKRGQIRREFDGNVWQGLGA